MPANLALRLSSSQKNSGAKKIATAVEARMPPITPVPIARRLFAPFFFWLLESLSVRSAGKKAGAGGAAPAAAPHAKREGD